MKEKTCCFTGHRRMPKDKLDSIIKRLDQEIDNLISQDRWVHGKAQSLDD